MKKNNSFGSGLLYAVVAIVFTSVLAISCQKNSLEIEEKTNETYRQKEIAKFINKIEERGDNQSGQIIIHNASKKPSEEIYFENYNDLTDILNPIIEKLSVGATATTTLTEDDGPHGHADCKYCSKLGGLSCGKSIANAIPEDAEDIHITVSKKDKKGCRTIHAEW